MNMAGKTVLITGSTDGVGRYVAKRLAAEGAQILIHGRDTARAKTLERFPLNLNREIIGVPSGVQIRFGSSDDNGGGCAMAKGYSKELRERVVAIVEEGDSAREAARLLNVGASTAIRWIERWTTTGSVEAKPSTGLNTV